MSDENKTETTPDRPELSADDRARILGLLKHAAGRATGQLITIKREHLLMAIEAAGV